MARRNCGGVAGLAALGAMGISAWASAAEVAVFLPLHRAAYQTNEWIDVSVARSDAQALPAGKLTLTLAGADASRLTFTFDAKAVPARKDGARAVEHLHVNGRLLRPGKYTIEAAVDGAKGDAHIEVYSHLRRSNFRLVDWGSSGKGIEQTILGEDSMGFNLLYVTQPVGDDIIRGGADFMRNCTMSGGHQMDLRVECDWSDPYVLQGGAARVVAEALHDRTFPNCIGVHFYDEPGLTWWKDPKVQDLAVPFNVPAQDRSYKSAFGVDAPHWADVKVDDPKAAARWDQMNRWKEEFMDAAWKYAQYGVSQVRPDLLSVTQSQYGWQAYADGYYFNVVRDLPVISGHGGYDDGPATYFYPSLFHEFGRARDLNKPVWYMPTWYGESDDQYRLEQYLSFMTNLQGMAKPPDMRVQDPAKTIDAQGIVETNKIMARLGTIFTTMRPTRPRVAVLYSLSQDLGAEVRDMQTHDTPHVNRAAYEGGDHTRPKLLAAYLAGKMIHLPVFPIVEEDITDGTLAANHKAVILPGVNYLDPKVVTALEAYINGGGTVLLSDDSQVRIKGATRLSAEAPVKLYHQISELWAKDQNQSMKLRNVEYWLKEVAPFAHALQEKLGAIGIKPALDADSPSIITQRQAQGDIEYLFAVNATPRPDDAKVHIQSAQATLSMAADGRPVYDALHGVPEDAFKAKDNRLSATLRFGPGEMRVFARTARPIGGVQVHAPVLFRDFTVQDEPVRIESAATLLDDQHDVLSGAAPMRIRLIDPLGQTRYDIYRATDRGMLRIDLPLAANDPAGQWKLDVQELLSGRKGHATFTYDPATQCGAAAGATRRAVYFGDDRQHIFRLFREHQQFTIVTGKGDYQNAAERVAQSLKPWGATCKIVAAADVKARPVPPEALKTWAGLSPSRPDPKNLSPNVVGWDVTGPAILIGTPEDNPLIKFAAENHFLPYDVRSAHDAKKPPGAENADEAFPGPGRGYIAWQRDCVGYGQDSVTLIGYDPQGIAQAVGSFYEAVAGLDPLTRYALPAPAAIVPATARTAPPESAIAWRAVLPDRVVSMKIENDQVIAQTEDGSTTKIDAEGKVVSRAALRAGETQKGETHKSEASKGQPKLDANLQKALVAGRVVKTIAAGKDASGESLTGIGYWGGTLQIVDGSGATKSLQVLPNDITALAWVKGKLIVGMADGEVDAVSAK